MIRLEKDPRPECEHEWCGLGTTAIYEPAIGHNCCFKCRTFKHRTFERDRQRGREFRVDSLFYSREWMNRDHWNWEAEAARAGKELGPAEATDPDADVKRIVLECVPQLVRQVIREEVERTVAEAGLTITADQKAWLDRIFEVEPTAPELVIHDRTDCGTPTEIVVPMPVVTPIAEAERVARVFSEPPGSMRYFTIYTADGWAYPNNGTDAPGTDLEAADVLRRHWEGAMRGASETTLRDKAILRLELQPDGEDESLLPVTHPAPAGEAPPEHPSVPPAPHNPGGTIGLRGGGVSDVDGLLGALTPSSEDPR